MLRRSMRIIFAFALLASILMPASVFAQEETQPPEPGQTISGEPVLSPTPVVGETPPDTPPADPLTVDGPIGEAPASDLPVMDEPEIEPPAAETDSSDSQPESVAETPDNTGQVNEPPAETIPAANEEETPVDAAADTIELTMSLSCAGIVTYTGGPDSDWTIMLYGTSETPNVLLDTVPLAGPGTDATAEFSIPFDWDTSVSQSYLAVATANEETIGTATADCDPYEEPDEPDDELPVSYVSALSVSCDGTVTFTIDEATGETLWITLTDPRAPAMYSLLGEESFEATEAGTFTISFETEARNTLRATVSSNDDIFALVTNCLGEGDGEDDSYPPITNLTITCDGVAALDVDVGIVGINAGLHLYGSNGSYWQNLGGTPLLQPGASTYDFEISAGVWNTLRVEATSKWSLLATTTVTGCLDQEPEPELVLPVVENLTVDCTGLVSFDLDTSEPVELQVWVGTPAQAPGFSRETYVTLSSGSHQVQLDVPVGRFDRHTALVALDAEEWHELAETTITGCRDQTAIPNTPEGQNVVFEKDGASVGFDAVFRAGVTSVTVLDPAQAPALPDGFDPSSAILLDISSTAVFDGAVTVCVPMSAAMIANAENVRMLHFESGAWVDITTSVSAETGLACGSPNSFSPFAIVQIGSGSGPGPGPGPHPNPGKPSNPGHAGGHGAHGQTGSSVNTTGGASIGNLPNTGAGAGLAQTSDRSLPLVMSMLALVIALGVRAKPVRARRMRSR